MKYGRNCPSTCLSDNFEYPTLRVAWTACEVEAECRFVMKYGHGKYFIRRSTDPNLSGKGIVGYTYNKPCSGGKCIILEIYMYRNSEPLLTKLLYFRISLNFNP